jgi:hypothetical protein
LIVNMIEFALIVFMAFLGGVAYSVGWKQKQGPSAGEAARYLILAVIAGILISIGYFDAFTPENAIIAFASGWFAPDVIEMFVRRGQNQALAYAKG